MKLLVVSYKRCRLGKDGYVSDGGFPIQMRALSELFDATTLFLERDDSDARPGDIPLAGHTMRIVRSKAPPAILGYRKLGIPIWIAKNIIRLLREIRAHDAVHTPVPCDTGSIAMLLAWLLRKPLYVRHCGNWFETRTRAERFWHAFMESVAGGRNVMLATGGGADSPSRRNPEVRWIFSTTITAGELRGSSEPERSVPVDEPRLILVGRQEHGKGTDVLLHTVAALRERGVAARAEVVGEGGRLQEYRAMSAALGLDTAVTFHGRLSHDNVLHLLRQAHLFLFPTMSEGFPKAVLEALATGLPVITTPVSVLPSLLSTGAGCIVPEREPQLFADAVMRCIGDTEAYREMSRRAVETAAQFTLESYSATLHQLLSQQWGELRHA